MSSMPDIADFEDKLFRMNAMMGASEAHGALCGMLCAQGTADLSMWADHVLGEQPESNPNLHDAVHLLSSLHRHTLEQLNDAEVVFELLLPDDDEPLNQRINALASWCQGFIYGLSAGGISDEKQLPGDCAEMLKDFIEISRAQEEDDDSETSEENEQAYMEILEYVRMGTLLMNEELQPLTTNPTIQ